jgi:hypothetical protein
MVRGPDRSAQILQQRDRVRRTEPIPAQTSTGEEEPKLRPDHLLPQRLDELQSCQGLDRFRVVPGAASFEVAG